MDCHNYSTNSTERKKGQHLRMEDRGAIKALRQQGLGDPGDCKAGGVRAINRDKRIAARHTGS